MANSNPKEGAANRGLDKDNRKQSQARQAQERKQSGQSGSKSGHNNISPARGKDDGGHGPRKSGR